jgi:predicted transcriptional regulator
MSQRNITLSLPEETLQEVKLLAVKRNTSVSALLSGMLSDLVAKETGYRQAQQEFMALAEAGFDLGTGGNITWSRDELHER